MPSPHDLYLEPMDPGDETCTHCSGSVDGSDLCESVAVARAGGQLEPPVCFGCCEIEGCECAETAKTRLATQIANARARLLKYSVGDTPAPADPHTRGVEAPKDSAPRVTHTEDAA